jgi:hypothetical protein
MKRVTTKLVVFLLAGAIMNIAVAWGFAYQTRELVDHSMNRITGEDVSSDRWWIVTCNRRLAFTSVSWWMARFPSPPVRRSPIHPRDVIPSWSHIPTSTQHIRDEDQPITGRRSKGVSYNAAAWGFPARTLWLQYDSIYANGADISGGWVVGSRYPPNRIPIALPLRPIWPGFAINTIFYAAVLWMLFAVPGAVQRLRGGVRRKRGQCASCGYSLRGTPHVEKCPDVARRLPIHQSFEIRP